MLYVSIMDSSIPIEETESFSCGYCSQDMGSLSSLIENQALAEHECLRYYDNVTINYENFKIYKAGTDGEPEKSVHPGNLPDRLASAGHFTEEAIASTSTSSSLQNQSEIWTDQMVKLLISVYKENKDRFDSPSFTKKRVWEIISQDFNKFGYNKSGTKCDEKWRNLRKTYDKVRTEKGKTGNSRVTWKFFPDFHEIYWKDPHFVPLSTASTSGAYHKRKLEGDDNISETITESPAKKKNLSPGEKTIKRRTLTADEIELGRQRRHDEKMLLKRDIFNWFKENYSGKKD